MRTLFFVLSLAALMPAEVNFTISPTKVERGRTYTVLVKKQTCDANDKITAVENFDSGLELGSAAVADDGCSYSGRLTVSDTAGFGPAQFQVKAGAKLVGVVSLSVVPLQAEPIPPGMDPEVDVAWKILDWKQVADAFGRKVADQYFAVDVSLGNNTGYPIQLAGVYFAQKKEASKTPNDPYHITRSTIERDRETGGRAILMNSLSLGLGVLPVVGAFFGTGRPLVGTVQLSARERLSTFIAAGAPLALGLNMLIPDKTVRHLIGMDTRAMRENMIIQNNTAVRILTFISRGSVEAANTATAGLASASNATPGIIKGRKFSPPAVKTALGALYVIGDQIQFINRVRVVSRSTEIETATPVALADPSPLFLSQGEKDKVVKLQGNGMLGLVASIKNRTDVSVTETKVLDAEGRKAEIKVKADDNAAPGPFIIELKNSDGRTGTVSTPGMVRLAAPSLTAGQTHGTAIKQGSSGDVSLAGTRLDNVNLPGTALSAACDGCTVTFKSKTATTVALTVTIAATAKPGALPVELLAGGVSMGKFTVTVQGETPSGGFQSGPTLTAGTADTTLTLVVNGRWLQWATLEPPAAAPAGADLPVVGACTPAVGQEAREKGFSCPVTFKKRAKNDKFDFKLKNGTTVSTDTLSVTVN